MTYQTIQGDYWDWISYQIYGSEKYANVLMRENPSYADVVRFDSGAVLSVPTIQTQSNNVSAVPWGTLLNG